MDQLGQILELWKSAVLAGDEICLATVVGIEGSAYRRPGARLLLTAGGGRAGTISGGCLEAEVAKKAWWLTEAGSNLQRYSSFFDDEGDIPYGLGCGGTVTVLLERGEAAHSALKALRSSKENRTGSCIVTRIAGGYPGAVLILSHAGELLFERGADSASESLAREALTAQASRTAGNFYVEYVAPPPAVCVFGAGDDVKPLIEFTAAMGWHVTVADSRVHLLQRERFPMASRVVETSEALTSLRPADSAVVMTHSYEQDRRLLGELIPMNLKYLGVLGPKLRTQRLVCEVAESLGRDVGECIDRLHSPVGLDIGGHSPASVALSITAELQACFAGREIPRTNRMQPIHA